MKFKFLEHTADVKFLAFGRDLNKAFENSALAMFAVMYGKKIKKKLKRQIQVSGRDMENLLYNFLEELLFLMDSEGFFLSKCRAEINEKNFKLKAEIYGDKAENYPIGLDVKAVTYNEMFIKKEKHRYIIQVVLDV